MISFHQPHQSFYLFINYNIKTLEASKKKNITNLNRKYVEYNLPNQKHIGNFEFAFHLHKQLMVAFSMPANLYF